jgi:peptidyl-prolyl cis-trans isomerase D
MLDTMRANRRNILTALLFGIIIFVFVVSFGPGSQGCQGAQPGGSAEVASVNGESIGAEDFEQQYAQLYRMYQQQAGEGFTQELADQMGLRESALEQLVIRELILQEAERQGLVVTDEELERSIKESPAFQSGGHFDHEYYTRTTSSAYGSPGRFEARMREDLLVQKMATLVRQAAKVSPDEIKDAWLAEADRVNLELVSFPVDAAKAEVKPTEEEVRAYAAANAKKIEDFYKATPAAFQKQKRVAARHILVKVDASTPDATAQQKAQQILERARKGEDFAQLARETSQDERSKEQGGELGEFGPGVMAKPFEEAAFALKAGEIGGPVRTQFGWHVIKVEDVKETGGGTLEEARPAIARQLLEEERATALARKKAAAALAALQSGKSFAEVFPAQGAKGKSPVTLGGKALQPVETGLFSPVASGTIPRLGAAPDLAAAAVGAKGPGVLPQVYDTPQGPVVARVKERQRPDESQLPTKSGEIAERLRSRREGEVEQAWVAALRQQADVTVNDALVGSPASVAQ